ncbi:MAG: tRNA lysidine(34) synthetase TilS [Gemmatimonadetes bacterium]|nr:tRNA lysidine(34) synthetase TilS [Gemmatimonadota bacterium]
MPEPSLLERLREHLTATGLLAEPGLALLAVSGGADSLALLDLLSLLAPELRLSLLVAHADHGIVPGSASVAREVEALARRRYGLEVVVGVLGLGAGASETRSRIARYRFLRRVQAERRARYLLTGHHADDQIETVLMRVLRGSAPSGLAGIRATGPRGLVRPLLPFRRAELLAHAGGLGVPIAQDPTNADPTHLRAWIRGALLPLIEERMSGTAAPAVLEVARHAAREVAAWDAALERLSDLALATSPGRLEVARRALTGYDNALAGRILRAAARRAGLELGPGAADRLHHWARHRVSGRRITLGRGLVGEIAFDRLVVRSVSAPPPRLELTRSGGGGGGPAAFGGYLVRWRAEPAPADVPRGGWTTWVEAADLAVRPPTSGDRMIPIGGVGRRTVARLLMEARVPRSDRSAYPVLVCGEDVLWIPGVCRGAAAIPALGATAVRVDVAAG